MKVFRVRSDFTYQAFYPYDPSDPAAPETVRADILAGSGTKRESSWQPTKLFVHDPSLERGNFGHLWGFGGFVIDSFARKLLQATLSGCELLPFLPLDGTTYYRVNLITRIDCLDHGRTKWRTDNESGERTDIRVYHFDPDRLTSASLFKIPEDEIYLTAVGLEHGGMEFKAIFDRHGLRGLKFQEIWSQTGNQTSP